MSRIIELNEFDWLKHRQPTTKPPAMRDVGFVNRKEPYERKQQMLAHLARACVECSMCDLGLREARRGDVVRDPHVFSNLNPTRFMVIGQNPGWNELKAGAPFVGAAGKNFDSEIAKHGFSRDDFYICNTVRCFTAGNTRPTEKNKQRCEPFLRMEINLIKPKLVVALGGVAFSQLCPEAVFGDSLKKITKSSKYNIPVFTVYHPSPMNLNSGSRKESFASQIKTLCKLIVAMRQRDGDQ